VTIAVTLISSLRYYISNRDTEERKLATPTRAEIVQRARQLYAQECCKSGTPELVDISPTVNELRESGTWSQAISELMMEKPKHEFERFEGYIKKAENFGKKQVVTELPFAIKGAMDTGFFIAGARQSGKTTLAKHLAQKLIQRGICVYVLDVSRAWANNTPITNIMTIPYSKEDIHIQLWKSRVFDLSNLGYAARHTYVNEFTQAVYDAHKAFGYKKAPFEFIFYEEAQTYVPNGSFRSITKYAPLVDLITVGANFNLSFALITQFPALVDKTPVKAAQQRYFGWSTEKNEVDYIRKFVGKEYVKPENPDSIINLRKGEFLYQLRNKIEKCKVEPFKMEKPLVK
jgi:hypothetical protein